MAETARRQVGGCGIIEVDASPVGSLTGEAGTLALDKTNGKAFVNTDGSTGWTNPLGGLSHILQWATRAQTFAQGDFWIANGKANVDNAADNATDPGAIHAAPITGTITALAYVSESGDNTTEADIFINGTSAGTVTWTAQDGVTTGLSISVTAGDEIAIQWSGGTDPDGSAVVVLIEE